MTPNLTHKLTSQPEKTMYARKFGLAAAAAAAATLAAALTLATSTAWASGSDTASGGDTDDAQAYNVGKGVYAQKLGCKSCPFAGKRLDATLAREVSNSTGLPAVTALSEDDKRALGVYLTRRFKL